MIVFPNAKINLGLRILRKREDNFHDIETGFYPLPLYDALELLPATSSETSFAQSGIELGIDPAQNLCLRAYTMLKNRYPELPQVTIHLHKAIPAGAGLGGGSADASFLLKAIVQLFNIPISKEALAGFALQLGSDCPFFLFNLPAIGTGRGEVLQPLALDLKGYSILLINPGIHISTSWAFNQIQPSRPEYTVAAIVKKPVAAWRDLLLNDFEPPVFARHPEVGAIKIALYKAGAEYAAMSGTGSTVFGIFKTEKLNTPQLPPHYMVRTIRL